MDTSYRWDKTSINLIQSTEVHLRLAFAIEEGRGRGTYRPGQGDTRVGTKKGERAIFVVHVERPDQTYKTPQNP